MVYILLQFSPGYYTRRLILGLIFSVISCTDVELHILYVSVIFRRDEENMRPHEDLLKVKIKTFAGANNFAVPINIAAGTNYAASPLSATC